MGEEFHLWGRVAQGEGFKNIAALANCMRQSILIGIVVFSAGMIIAKSAAELHQGRIIIGAYLVLVISSLLIGTGAGLTIHWLLGFAKKWKTAIAEIVISFAALFVGIGAAVMSQNVWKATQVLIAFVFASLTIMMMSPISLITGLKQFIGKEATHERINKVRRKVRRV